MLLKFLKSAENQLKLTIVLVMVISTLALIRYSDISNKNSLLYESELKLYQIGKAYEYELKSELDKYYSILEILSVSISKNIQDKDFKTNTKAILRSLIAKHERINSVGLFLKMEEENRNEDVFALNDSLSENSIQFIRSKSGIYEEFAQQEFNDLNLKVEIENAIVKEQTTILSPGITMYNEQGVSVIPIVSSIFKGKRFIGYLIIHVSIDWPKKSTKFIYNSVDNFEAYVSSGNGKLIATKDNDSFLSEDIKKICFPCSGLLGERGTPYNSLFKNGYLTLCMSMNIEHSIKKWDICLRSREDSLMAVSANRIYLWILGTVLLVLSLVLIFNLIKRTNRPWEELQVMINGILTGEFDRSDFSAIPKDPAFAKIKSSLFSLASSLTELATINKLVVSGDFSKEFNVPEFKHKLFASSNALYQHVKTNDDKLNQSLLENKQAKQFTEGLDKISDILKLHHKDLHQLSEQIIRTMVDLMDIAMGAVFLIKEEDGKSVLDLEVSYAYHENRYQKRTFAIGESLVGACAAEKRIIHLKKIPEGYLKIISGLGHASPKSLLIVPLIFEDEVLGAIELGTLEEFDKKLMDFAESAAESIANTLSLAKNNIRNSKLLEKTQLQTKELEERDRKMKEALAELKELQGKTARSEADVRAKLEAMNNTLMIVEYTVEGILLDANYKFLNTMHYSLDEIRDINVIELLKEEDRNELIKVMNTVKSGNFYEAIMRRYTKLGQEKWFLASYTPVFNDEGTVQNILFFGVDITRMKTNEDKLKAKAQELVAELNRLKKI